MLVNGVRPLRCISKKGRHRSISKRSSKPSDKPAEASKRTAAKLVIGDLNLGLEFAKTALDSYEAGDREHAKGAKGAARKSHRTILSFMPETRLIEAKLKELEQALKKIRRV